MVLIGCKCTAHVHSCAPALFSSFWQFLIQSMGSIYLSKLKIHRNVICLKSFKLGLSSTWTKNFQIYKLGFKEAEEPMIKLLTSDGSWRKQGSFRKTPTSASLSTLKPLTVWIPTNWKILRGGNSRPPYLSPEKLVCRTRRNRLDMK